MRQARLGRYRKGAYNHTVAVMMDPGHVILDLDDFLAAREAFDDAVEVIRAMNERGAFWGGVTLRLVAGEPPHGAYSLILAGVSATAALAAEVESAVLEGSDEGWK